jgi:NAD(P)-dependent dehydrogenase (short-subunit alcohol dehydrogenase family)
MTTVSVDGRVAIVTGAGRGLGRAYAHLLAERGARVVVNDLGTNGEGYGRDDSLAAGVAAKIVSESGDAVADFSDIATVTGGEEVVTRALDTFGRIDIVVNNAGICGSQLFEDATLGDFEHYMRIHLGGHVNVTKAAWPHMVNQKHGRIICTESSAGLYGLRGQSTYAAAKGAVHGLMRSLAIEGEEHGILSNSIEPGGYSRMHPAAISDSRQLERMRVSMPPELVAPAIVWLASDQCTVTGHIYTVRSGLIVRVAMGFGTGYFHPQLTPELIAENQAAADSLEGFYEPREVLDGLRATTRRPEFRASYPAWNNALRQTRAIGAEGVLHLAGNAELRRPGDRALASP